MQIREICKTCQNKTEDDHCELTCKTCRADDSDVGEYCVNAKD